MSERTHAATGERVRRGAALLDEKGPEGWRDKINLDRLVIVDPEWCILGQVYETHRTDESPSYTDALAFIGASWDDADDYGFVGVDEESDSVLEDAWREYLSD